jgi:Ion channel
VLSNILVDSALFYYMTGTRSNWNMKLSHVDALTVAVGTLTTAGTAGITPRSETARAIMLGQMAADFVAVTILVAIVLQRVASKAVVVNAGQADVVDRDASV